MELKSFTIKKLCGRKDCVLKFIDNRLILVGENGAGKTTVLRVLFLFLSGQWTGLSKYVFDSVSINLGGKLITLSRSEISKKIPSLNKHFMKRLPPLLSKRVQMMLTHEESIDVEELESLCDRVWCPI
jgi:ABC-type Mn2+/Zn2+ transport system ATPase subunit